MFGLFKKKSKIEVLEERYKKLMKEGYELSTSNRIDSFKKYAEAEELQKEIEILKQNEAAKN